MSRSVEEIKNEMDLFDKDKRSKAWKLLKEELASASDSSSVPSPSKGLGDITEKVIKATGLDKLVEPDCEGCKNRKRLMNEFGEETMGMLRRLFHGKKKLNDLSEEDFNYLDEYFSKSSNVITSSQQKELIKIYYNISLVKRQPSSCASCVKKLVNTLRIVYNEYKKGNG